MDICPKRFHALAEIYYTPCKLVIKSAWCHYQFSALNCQCSPMLGLVFVGLMSRHVPGLPLGEPEAAHNGTIFKMAKELVRILVGEFNVDVLARSERG